MMLEVFCRNKECSFANIIRHQQLTSPNWGICPQCGNKTFIVAPARGEWHDPDKGLKIDECCTEKRP